MLVITPALRKQTKQCAQLSKSSALLWVWISNQIDPGCKVSEPSERWTLQQGQKEGRTGVQRVILGASPLEIKSEGIGRHSDSDCSLRDTQPRNNRAENKTELFHPELRKEWLFRLTQNPILSCQNSCPQAVRVPSFKTASHLTEKARSSQPSFVAGTAWLSPAATSPGCPVFCNGTPCLWMVCLHTTTG